MKNINKSLQIEQLDRKLRICNKLKNLTPSSGWIYATRNALGMSLGQLGQRLGITAQSVREMEQREKDGSISLKNLNDAARAFGLKLVYGFSTLDKSLNKIIEVKAGQLAEQIVLRTNRTMRLEKQANSSLRLKKAIKDRIAQIINDQPRNLWD